MGHIKYGDFMKKRLCACFFAFTFIFTLLISKIFSIIQNEDYKNCASQQSSTVLNVMNSRGTIYDRNFKSLVNEEYKYIAAVNPNNYSADALLKNTPQEMHEEIGKKLSSHMPFTIEVPNDNIYSYGIDIFEVPKRYKDEQTALHIIGETSDNQKDGVSGLEKCYDSLLKASGGFIDLKYPSNALNHSLKEDAPKIYDTSENIKGGIVTTLDKDIQRITEEAGKDMEKGAIVVMDILNGDILASASFPTYNPNQAAKSLDDPLKPFINRAFYPFAVGSTFKLLTAATALEEGISPDFTHTCKGYIEVGSNIFRCHNLSGHGKLNMEEALRKSCNPYFINLSKHINGQSLLYKAKLLGMGEKRELAPDFFTVSGKLPNANDLFAPEALANFSFGQGDFTATPIDIAVLISSFANGGKSFVPRLIEGSTEDGVSFLSHSARYEPKDVILPSVAEKVRKMMVSVVEEGSGKKAKPQHLGAGGKTASAQSGQFRENGEEIVHAWFSGFYPAENPKFAIVVLCEGAFSGGDTAAPIFKEICDKIYDLKGEEYFQNTKEQSITAPKENNSTGD